MDWRADFGEFARLFEAGAAEPNYLSLLNLYRGGSGAVQAVRSAALAEPEPKRRIEALLSVGAGWRPHLVGGVALRFTETGPAEIGALWNAADVSWVGPQMVALAARLDPEFELNAAFRIGCGCRHRPQFPSRFQPGWPHEKPRGKFDPGDAERPTNFKLLGALAALSASGSHLHEPADAHGEFQIGQDVASDWSKTLDEIIAGLPPV
jgi:hypothetical protein